MPIPDRLYIDANTRDVLAQMKETNFLNTQEATNKELFLYAMALGIDAPSNLEGSKDGLFLEKDMTDFDSCFLYASFIPTIDNIDCAQDKGEVYDFAQKCAKTGFVFIQNLLDTSGIETLDKQLLQELDQQYEELIGSAENNL